MSGQQVIVLLLVAIVVFTIGWIFGHEVGHGEGWDKGFGAGVRAGRKECLAESATGRPARDPKTGKFAKRNKKEKGTLCQKQQR